MPRHPPGIDSMGGSATFQHGLMTQPACQHQRGLSFLVGMVSDGNCECRYNKNVPCAWGAVKALRALVEVPPDVRSADFEGAVRKTAEFLAS